MGGHHRQRFSSCEESRVWSVVMARSFSRCSPCRRRCKAALPRRMHPDTAVRRPSGMDGSPSGTRTFPVWDASRSPTMRPVISREKRGLSAQCLSTQILQIISIDNQNRLYAHHLLLGRECLVSLTLFPGKSALGKGWGAWGEGSRERLFSLRCEKAGPSRAGGDRKAARRAVPVGDAGALRASTAERGVPLPPKQTANGVNRL